MTTFRSVRALPTFEESHKRILSRIAARRNELREKAYGELRNALTKIVKEETQMDIDIDSDDKCYSDTDPCSQPIDDDYINQMLLFTQQLFDDEKIPEEYYNGDGFQEYFSQHQNGVICPFCAKHYWAQNGRLLYCRCGFCLNVHNDKLTLNDIRTQLESVEKLHNSADCCGQIEFSLKDRFGIQAIYASCKTCKLLDVVV